MRCGSCSTTVHGYSIAVPWMAVPSGKLMRSWKVRPAHSSLPSRMRFDHGTSGYDAVSAARPRSSSGVGRKTSTHSPPTRTWPNATDPPVAGTSPTRQWSFSMVTISGMRPLLRMEAHGKEGLGSRTWCGRGRVARVPQEGGVMARGEFGEAKPLGGVLGPSDDSYTDPFTAPVP